MYAAYNTEHNDSGKLKTGQEKELQLKCIEIKYLMINNISKLQEQSARKEK